MSTERTPGEEALAAARRQIPSCALSDADLQAQQARFRRLAPDSSLRRGDATLVVEFRAGFDRGALDAMIAVERECCPFFTFDFTDAARRLEIGVNDPEQAPALDALAEQLTGATPTAE